jgi:hypothetical protein
VAEIEFGSSMKRFMASLVLGFLSAFFFLSEEEDPLVKECQYVCTHFASIYVAGPTLCLTRRWSPVSGSSTSWRAWLVWTAEGTIFVTALLLISRFKACLMIMMRVVKDGTKHRFNLLLFIYPTDYPSVSIYTRCAAGHIDGKRSSWHQEIRKLVKRSSGAQRYIYFLRERARLRQRAPLSAQRRIGR